MTDYPSFNGIGSPSMTGLSTIPKQTKKTEESVSTQKPASTTSSTRGYA